MVSPERDDWLREYLRSIEGGVADLRKDTLRVEGKVDTMSISLEKVSAKAEYAEVRAVAAATKAEDVSTRLSAVENRPKRNAMWGGMGTFFGALIVFVISALGGNPTAPGK